MILNSDNAVKSKLENYPPHIKPLMDKLRSIVLETASKIDGLQSLDETLKWGEPSYLTKNGSTVRFDWKEKHPEQYAVYFKCTSKLVPTFKQLYGDTFNYEGNRALVFKLGESLPEEELKHCISLALTYHKVKKKPLLGAAGPDVSPSP